MSRRPAPLGDPLVEPGPTVQTNVRLTAAQRTAFAAAARRYSMTLAQWLRALAIDAVRQNRAPFTQD